MTHVFPIQYITGPNVKIVELFIESLCRAKVLRVTYVWNEINYQKDFKINYLLKYYSKTEI